MPLSFFARTGQPSLAGGHDLEGVAVGLVRVVRAGLELRVRLGERYDVAFSHISLMGELQVVAEQAERQCVAVHFVSGVLELLIVRFDLCIACPLDPCLKQQLCAGLFGEVLQGPLRRGRVAERG